MLLKNRRALLGIALLAMVGVDGCKAFRRGGPAPAVPDTVIEVENHSFPDVVMYAVTAGDPFRLGMVTGNGSAKFKLPARFAVGGTLQLLARPIAGRAYLLPSVSISPGDEVGVVLESTPVQSHVIVLPR